MDVMIVDDDLVLQVQIARALMGCGLGVICAGGVAMAQSVLRLSPPRALILGERIDGRLSHGLALLAECRNPEVAVVMLTDRTGPDLSELSDLMPAIRALLGRRIGAGAVVQVLRSVLDGAGAMQLTLVPVPGAGLTPTQAAAPAVQSPTSAAGGAPTLPWLQSLRPMPTGDRGVTSGSVAGPAAALTADLAADMNADTCADWAADLAADMGADPFAAGTDAPAPAGIDAGDPVPESGPTGIAAPRTLAPAGDDAAEPADADTVTGPDVLPFAPLVANRRAWAAWRTAAGLPAELPAAAVLHDGFPCRADGSLYEGDGCVAGPGMAWPRPDAAAKAQALSIQANWSDGAARRMHMG